MSMAPDWRQEIMAASDSLTKVGLGQPARTKHWARLRPKSSLVRDGVPT